MITSRRNLLRTSTYMSVALLASLASACAAMEPVRTPTVAPSETPTTLAQEPATPAATPPVSPTPAATPTVDRSVVPPGQRVIDRFPVLDLGIRPVVTPEEWYLDVRGTIENPVTLTWDQFKSLPRVQRTWHFNCVTGWTKENVPWEGVLMQEIISMVRPRDDVVAIILEGRDGYTTNLSYEEALREEILLADTLEGEELPLPHGGPVRAVVPYLYGWKSCKFLNIIRFELVDEPGYWEIRGYHNHADPWREERFG
ncbi:MAG: molybdopterin-dependent oxidoreductase [Anaerolineae bacterium]|jgi:DMSO/TMAO reductase YedYZ molybdopterin-dependent catalytic subunit